MTEKKVRKRKSTSKKNITKKPFYKKWWFIFICGIVTGMILSPLTSNTSNTKDSKEIKKEETSAKPNKKKDKKNDDTFKDNSVDGKSAKIQYTGSEIGTDYDGKPILYTFFTVTNKNEEAKNAQFLLLEYVGFSQNLGSTTKRLEYGITTESPYKDELDLLQQDINPDGTVDLAYASSIEDESKPVTITFKDGVAGKKVGEIEVDVK